MSAQLTPPARGTLVPLSYEAAARETEAALVGAGFDLIAETDVRALQWRHGGKRVRPYTLLSAWHPALADAALRADPGTGPLVVCTVAVYAADEPGRSVVCASDPAAALAGDAALEPIARRLRARLAEALARVAEYEPPAASYVDVEEVEAVEEAGS
jgi:uncharacterized protein (DUF302 family)